MKTLDALMGLCVGDALGVPVEFFSRDVLKNAPVTDMTGYGTHNQPAGTWSDDSSLAFCLAESLCQSYDLQDIAQKFLAWYREEAWTPHGRVFDIGIATSKALQKIAQGTSPLQSGGEEVSDNGNGSLMRILPLVFCIKDKPIAERYKMVAEVSRITHAHIQSVWSCFIYCEYALLLLAGKEKMEAYQETEQSIGQFVEDSGMFVCGSNYTILQKFNRILNRSEPMPLLGLKEEDIQSSGYVIHTLEASLWCFLTTDSYSNCVLKAVNLGNDTDTTGCVAGGLAGLYYGLEAIPEAWRKAIVKREAIETLAQKLAERYA